MTLEFTPKSARVRSFGARLAVLVLIGAGLLLSLGTQVADISPTAPVSHAVAASETAAMSHCRELSNPHKTVRFGDRGITVSHAQCLLKYHWGQNIDVDRIFGRDTHDAVVRVQENCGLDNDGIVGRNTWRVLHRQGRC